MRVRSLLKRTLLSAFIASLGAALAFAANAPVMVHYDGAPWHINGEGVVMCPCAVPCPCRSNSTPTYGHCESTLYLHIRSGHYGAVDLGGLTLVQVGGDCAMCHKLVGALYFDQRDTAAQQQAYMKLVASFSAHANASFPMVRVVPVEVRESGSLLKVSVPGILVIMIDRNWGQAEPPMPIVAAPDHYANALRYVQNLKYVVHDPAAHLDFDYSRRQANLRMINLDLAQYRSKSMLIQFADGSGWFDKSQLSLVKQQRLVLPDLSAIGQKAMMLKRKHPGVSAAVRDAP